MSESAKPSRRLFLAAGPAAAVSARSARRCGSRYAGPHLGP